MIILFAAVAAALSVPVPSRQLVLPDSVNRALLSGLENRLGSKFILSGIANAQEICDVQESCTTTAQLRKQATSDDRLAAATSVRDMTNAVLVGGKVPVAVVSILSARKTSRGNIKVKMIVNNPETGGAQVKLATVGYLPVLGDEPAGYSSTLHLRAWVNVSS